MNNLTLGEVTEKVFKKMYGEGKVSLGVDEAQTLFEIVRLTYELLTKEKES